MASALMKTRACTGKFDIHATIARLKILRGGDPNSDREGEREKTLTTNTAKSNPV
jgi:hypothetical protein